jgi:uncharacterized iron-regulated protein
VPLGIFRLAGAAWALLGGLSACASATPLPPGSPSASATSAAAREPLAADVVARSALPLHARVGGERLSEPELWARMATYRAVCLGEQHDSPAHHYAQRRAIEELAGRDPARPTAIGLEMFQKPYQAALSGFVQGSSSEAELLTQSEWQQRWGFDFALYRPLLEAARERRLEALALNARRELTRKIGREGLGALDATERAELPELDLDEPAHRAYFAQAMSGHPMPANGPKLDDMYAVQVVWDETMADTAARWLAAAGHDARLLVFAGSGHCHRSAIPARLGRRIDAPVLSLSAVLESKLDELPAEAEYDWLLVLEDGPRTNGS